MKRFVFFIVLIFLCSGVFGASVSPSSYSLNFDPGYSVDYAFEFGFGDGVESELYVSGDLAEYVTLDKEKLVGGGIVVATLSLPAEINLFGENRIRVGARQLSGGASGVGIVSDVRGLIKVNVPYPGKYVELELKASNANVGEPVNLSVEIFNRGEENVMINPILQIFMGENLIESINLGNIDVALMTSSVLDTSFDSSGYSSGNYSVTVLGEYGSGQSARNEDRFKLGKFFVKIVNYPREFREDKLEKFPIEVVSFYNNPIEVLYAEVIILGEGDASFSTPLRGLDAWQSKTLMGVLDTSNVDSENFQAEIILYYGTETTLETVNLKIIRDRDYNFFLILVGFFVVAGFLTWVMVVFVKRTKKKLVKRKK